MYGSLPRFAGVVPLLLLLLYRCFTKRMLLKFRGSVGWNRLSSCSGYHAHIRTLTEAPFVAVTYLVNNTLNYGYYCCTMDATTSKALWYDTRTQQQQIA